MTRLRLSLLGPFAATLEGTPLSGFESNKVRALLTFLVVENARPQQRIELATLLWPDKSDAAALRNLRHAVANLRRIMGDARHASPLLLVTPRTLQLNPDSVSSDVADFRQYLATAAQADGGVAALQTAADLVRGDLVAGLRVRGSAPWEEWLLLQREALSQAEREALRGLTTAYEQQRDVERALVVARRWVQRAAWDEEAHRQTMRLLAQTGQRAAALAQYERCRQVLQDDLDVAPAPETLALAEAIRKNAFPLPANRRPTPAPTAPASPRFVAREAALARLTRFWEQAMTGRNQIAFITGEAGSGKSALADAFAHQALARRWDTVVVRGESNALAEQGAPFLPFRDILLALIGDANALHLGSGMGEAYARRLQRLIPITIPILVQTAPDLVDALDLTDILIMQTEAFLPQGARSQALLRSLRQLRPHRDAPSRTAPASQRFGQYTRVLSQLARSQPLLLILDDLQWADAGSLALLFHLARRLHDSRILLLGVFRSDEVLAAANAPHPLLTIMRELKRRQGDILLDLDQEAGRAFVDAYLDAEPNRLDDDFRQELHRHTGGHALFTVELLRALQERRDLVRDEAGRWRSRAGLSWAHIPPRVEAIIAERIDRLALRWRTLLSVASIANEHFSVELLAQALAWPATEVQAILDHLAAPALHLVQFRGRAWVGKRMLNLYRFRHILFRDYLDQRLTVAERVRWHHQIGMILENLYAERIDEVALALARHFEAAQLPQKAAAYYLRAGRRAMQLFAPDEALALYGRGLALLHQAPDSAEKEEQEMALQLAMSAPLVAMAGWGAPERAQASQRAYELCRRRGNEKALMQAMFVQADMLRARGEHALSLQLGEQLLALAEQEGGAEGLALAHWTLGETYFFQGVVARAHRHLTRALTYYTPSDRSLTPLTPTDLGVVCHVWLAWLDALSGDPQAGEAHMQAALSLARHLDQPLSLIFALTLGAYGYNWLRDRPQAAAAYAEELAPLMVDEALAGLHPWGQVFQGWARAENGHLQEGIALMQAGLDAWRAMGAVSGRTCQVIPLARAYLRAGESKKARALLAETLSLVERTGERMFEPTLHRLWEEAAQE